MAKSYSYAEQAARVLALLAEGDKTSRELRAVMCMSERAVNGYLAKLTGCPQFGGPRLVRRSGYRYNAAGLQPAPLYGLGSDPDAELVPKDRRAPGPSRAGVVDRRDAKVRAELAQQAIAQATSRPQTWLSPLGM